MSRLSKLWHKEVRGAFESTIEYLETIDIPKERKKEIAVEVVKLLHLSSGGVWDEILEAGVVSAIDFVLADVRQWAADRYGPSQTPLEKAVPPSPPYDTEQSGPLPTDAALKQMGFIPGDVKWVLKSKTGWLIGHPGGVFDYNYAESVGVIAAY